MVRSDGRHFASGSLMAGTIALWLQAYPHLSHEQVMEILKKTSRKHADMKGKDWDSHYGYGLVDAYEGLKEALRLGKLEGLARPSASLEPVASRARPLLGACSSTTPSAKLP